MDRREIQQMLENSCHQVEAAALDSVQGTPAAVLIALLAAEEGPQVILTQRTANLKNHPSQISLPGGRIEDGEKPSEAALREAWEEVALPPDKVEILGCLPAFETISDFRVRPFVAWVEQPVELLPDASEVADVFLVPLAVLIDKDNYRRETIERDGVLHSYYVIAYPGRRIWGVTAGILHSLAAALTT